MPQHHSSTSCCSTKTTRTPMTISQRARPSKKRSLINGTQSGATVKWRRPVCGRKQTRFVTGLEVTPQPRLQCAGQKSAVPRHGWRLFPWSTTALNWHCENSMMPYVWTTSGSHRTSRQPQPAASDSLWSTRSLVGEVTTLPCATGRCVIFSPPCFQRNATLWQRSLSSNLSMERPSTPAEQISQMALASTSRPEASGVAVGLRQHFLTLGSSTLIPPVTDCPLYEEFSTRTFGKSAGSTRNGSEKSGHDRHGERNINCRKMKKVKLVRIFHWSESDENGNDCKIACDWVQRANAVLGLCKEVFARKHTATHKPTSPQRLKVTTKTHTHTHTHTQSHTHTHLIIAGWAPTPMAQRGNNRLWSPLAYLGHSSGSNNRLWSPRPTV